MGLELFSELSKRTDRRARQLMELGASHRLQGSGECFIVHSICEVMHKHGVFKLDEMVRKVSGPIIRLELQGIGPDRVELQLVFLW